MRVCALTHFTHYHSFANGQPPSHAKPVHRPKPSLFTPLPFLSLPNPRFDHNAPTNEHLTYTSSIANPFLTEYLPEVARKSNPYLGYQNQNAPSTLTRQKESLGR